MQRAAGRRGRFGPARATRIALVATAWVVAAPAAGHTASKEDKVFTVGNYPVEARASDAVAAKDRAISEGQQAAFRSLLKRIIPVTAYNRLAGLRALKAGDLIEGIAVRSERNSSTEYIASYDFVFQAEAVRRILDREGIPFLDRQAPAITLLAIYKAPAESGTPEMFADARGSDAWLYAWKGLDLANALTPVTLKTAKRQVHPDTIKALVEGDPTANRALEAEYPNETVLVALLEPALAEKRVRVTLAGRDAVAPFVLQRTYRLDGPDLAYTAELAAVVALGVLEGRWKAINVRGGNETPRVARATAAGIISDDGRPAPIPRPGLGDTGDGAMRIAVEFRSMGEWQQISRQLAQTPEIESLDVEGLSARGARVSLRYPGGAPGLALALAQQGLILRNGGGGWVLSQR